MDDEFEDEIEHPSFKSIPHDYAVVGLGFVVDVLDATSNFFGALRFQLAASANHRRDQMDFRREAALAIETITNNT